MINVLADQNLHRIEQFLPVGTELTLYDSHRGIPELEGFDALIVQTVTKLNKQTVPSLPNRLKFIGTGSSGIDHIDIDYFKTKGITIADAKGCNANAVAEYVMTALLLWQESHQHKKEIGKVGVIGAGKTGSAVIHLLQKFGIEFVAYDPPRTKDKPDFKSATLEEVLNCDILTFHVPLTGNGKYATWHWLNEEKLAGRSFQLIINAARGGIIDEQALLRAHTENSVKDFILDVWDNEPDFNPEVAQKAFIATPHIAGYSEQAKVTASKMVCGKLAEYFDLESPDAEYEYTSKMLNLPDKNFSLESILTEIHPIKKYEAELIKLIPKQEKQILFTKLRADFPFRFEYPFLKIRDKILDEFVELRKFGVKSQR